jgi:hypothetical protein
MKHPPRKCLDCETIITEKKKRRCPLCKSKHREVVRVNHRIASRRRRVDPAVREAERLAAKRYRENNVEKVRAAAKRAGRKYYYRFLYRICC